ncbi:MAG: FAD-dependent oxidoreductase [Acidimicrobiales bacterium]
MTRLRTEILIIGSGAGGAATAAVLAEAGRQVTVVEQGPWIDPDADDAPEPFSLQEMVARYRHHGLSAALGHPPIAYAEGRCVGGSTEINSGLWHRLPPDVAASWRAEHGIDGFEPALLDRWADRVESWLSVSRLPGAPPLSSAVLERGAGKLGWRSTEVPRAVAYDGDGRATRQTMARTVLPRAVAAGADVLADCRVARLVRSGDRVTGGRAHRRRPDGTTEPIEIDAEHVVVCGGAIQTPALLQRSGIRHRVGRGLKLHPTIKIAARFPHPVAHHDVPMHRVTEFGPELAIGGSASRPGHVGLALADSGAGAADVDAALADWEHVFVYYASIRSEGSGRVLAVPGVGSPLVTYRLTDGDLSRLARGLLLLGELLLAAGATELFPSVAGARVVRRPEELASWWGSVDRSRANLMTVHLTSTVGMGEHPARTGADSYGRVWGCGNLTVNDASLLPDAPGVNPQATIMTIAVRNAEHLLSCM